CGNCTWQCLFLMQMCNVSNSYCIYLFRELLTVTKISIPVNLNSHEFWYIELSSCVYFT
uniref:Uncharacterized protein n=1 Tax=Aegilops tauschii subsp. strangulata TaxID=200361 RepID=A0A453PJP7_AEGTS